MRACHAACGPRCFCTIKTIVIMLQENYAMDNMMGNVASNVSPWLQIRVHKFD